MILLLGGLIIFGVASLLTWIFLKIQKRNVLTLPQEWLESDTEIEVIGRDKRLTCTKDHPWDSKTLPILHVDADFIDDSNSINCPNCGHTWSIGPDV